MVKAAWGLKRTCQSCGAHFYDMHKSPIGCPKCGAVYDPDAVAKTRRSRTATSADKLAAQRMPVRRPEPEVEIAAVVADPELEVAEAEDEEEEDVIEDTSELGSDEDVATVIEKNEEDKET